jgi:hypothetical protein
MGVRQRLNVFYAALMDQLTDEGREEVERILNQEMPQTADERAEQERQRKARENAERIRGLSAAFSLPS